MSTAQPELDPAVVEELTDRALAFLEAHADRKPEHRWGVGSDQLNTSGSFGTHEEERAMLDAAQVWRQGVFDAGLGWIGGPPELGGGGGDRRLDWLYERIEAGFDVPNQSPIRTTTRTVAPAILEFGSPELKATYLRAMFRGEVQSCQLLSEPDAGSDLAALRTRAVRQGDGWLVTGHKVWTSYAHVADVGQLLARTDPDAPKHRGLTMFLVDMATPGVEVRPLRQMTGEAHFNEVFLDGVWIPDTHRVGDEGRGWRAIQTTFASERFGIGSGSSNGGDQFERLRDLLDHRPDGGPRVRAQFVDAWVHQEVNRHLAARLQQLAAQGRLVGPEGSMLKLANTRQMARISEVAGRLLGPEAAADSGAWGTYCWSDWICGSPGWRLAGGTDEVQRNLLAERLLGLPR